MIMTKAYNINKTMAADAREEEYCPSIGRVKNAFDSEAAALDILGAILDATK